MQGQGQRRGPGSLHWALEGCGVHPGAIYRELVVHYRPFGFFDTATYDAFLQQVLSPHVPPSVLCSAVPAGPAGPAVPAGPSADPAK